MTKGSIQQEDVTVVNFHAPNIGTSKLTDINGEIVSIVMIGGYFDTQLCING